METPPLIQWHPTNPHITRLQRQPGILNHHTTLLPCGIVLLIYTLISLCCMLLSTTFSILILIQTLPLLIVLILVLPIFLSAITNSLVNHDMASPDFELVLLTPLTDAQLIWSYFYIIVWRSRTFLAVLAFLLFLSLIPAVFYFAGDGKLPVRYLIMLLTLTIHSFGVQFFVIALTIMVSVWMRDWIGLRVLMPAMAFIVMAAGLLAILFLINDLSPVGFAAIAGLVLMVLPYGLTWVALRFAAQWLRN